MLPDMQRQMLAWLLRQGAVTLTELVMGTQRPEAEVRIALEDLVRRGFVAELDLEEIPHYQALVFTDQGDQFLNALVPTLEPGKPLAVIVNSAGQDTITPGSTFELGVTIRNKGNQSAVIDVFIDDLSPLLRQWCRSAQERLALGAKQSAEVVFRFQVPVDALPGSYPYLLIVDAPQHYPEDTPIRYSQKLQVLPPLQDAVRVNDPTFVVQPGTASAKPATVQPGGVLQFQLLVHNRSDRVDRFRLSCKDIPEEWLNTIYPQGIQGQGLAVQSDALDLNPGGQGLITLVLQPPLETIAGVYIPTLRLHSENNPNLVLLDLIYFQVKPTYQLQPMLQTILSQVKTDPGLFAIQISNQGNTPREILLDVTKLDGGDRCEYTFDPPHLKLQPKQTLSSKLWVKPIDPWKRPIFGGGQLLNFNVDLTDPEEHPISPVPLHGFIVWQSRPWWQILPFFLMGIAGVALLAWFIWWNLMRPPVSPKILKFAPDEVEYAAENGDFVRLGFQISDPDRVKTLEILGQSADGKVISRPMSYDLSKGIPAALRPFCLEQARVLSCRNVRTDARRPGTYIFTMNLLPRDRRSIPASSTSVPVAIVPIPLPQILAFNSTQPIYQQAPPKVQPALPAAKKTSKPAASNPPPAQPAAKPANLGLHEVRLNWTIAHPKQIQELQIIGHDAEGAVVSPLKVYNFQKGVPKELEKQCTLREQLVCLQVPTGDRKVGDRTYQITVIPKGAPPEKPIVLKTDLIKIEPRPPQILTFRINGQEALPKYILPITPGQPLPSLVFSWQAENNDGTKVELLPAPGAVATVGSMLFPLTPEPANLVVTLQVTNAAGQQITRSVTLETYNPAAPPSPGAAPGTVPGAAAPAAPPAPPAPPALDTPQPTDPNRLSPTELPPQFN